MDLSGSISEEINNVSSMLLRIDISNNRLSGSLPSSIGRLSALRILLIHGNQLSGNVPPEIGRLMNISKISLDGARKSWQENNEGHWPYALHFRYRSVVGCK